MATPNLLDVFGKELMAEVRDRAFRRISMILQGSLKGSEAVLLHQEFQSLAGKEHVAYRLAEEAIDTTLHDLLVFLDKSQSIQVRIHDGTSWVELRKVSDGLSGELYGRNGWIERFSTGGFDDVS